MATSTGGGVVAGKIKHGPFLGAGEGVLPLYRMRPLRLLRRSLAEALIPNCRERQDGSAARTSPTDLAHPFGRCLLLWVPH